MFCLPAVRGCHSGRAAFAHHSRHASEQDAQSAVCKARTHAHVREGHRYRLARARQGYRSADRELALYKIGAPHGARRSEILELSSIFGAKVVDVGPQGLTVALSGDPGKLFAFEQAVRPFGLAQLARTGRITLQKSDENLDLPGVMAYPTQPSPRAQPGPSSSRAPLIASPAPCASPVRRSHHRNSSAPECAWRCVSPPGVAGAERVRACAEGEPAAARPSDGADVYVASSTTKDGPWTVRTALNPGFDSREQQGFQAHTLLIEVNDTPGVLNEVTGVIARRGYNIQSLAVGNSEAPGRSRITTVLPGQPGAMGKLIKQIEKLVVVIAVQDVTNVPHVSRELMLVKVMHNPCLPPCVLCAFTCYLACRRASCAPPRGALMSLVG